MTDQSNKPAPIEADWTQTETPGSKVELETPFVEPEPVEETPIETPVEQAEPTEVAAIPAIEPIVEAEETSRIDRIDVADVKVQEPEVPIRRQLYRDETTVDEIQVADVAAERAAFEAAARAEAERIAAEKIARDKALGFVPASSGPALVAAAPPLKLVTDKFLGALSLFLFRIVIAGVLAIRGYQMMTDIPAMTKILERTTLPSPELCAWIASGAALLAAVALVFGMIVRVVGFGVAVMTGLALGFLRWGAFSPFVAGQMGFLGEVDLLVAAGGVLLFGLGGGRWGFDGAFRASRARAKAEKAD